MKRFHWPLLTLLLLLPVGCDTTTFSKPDGAASSDSILDGGADGLSFDDMGVGPQCTKNADCNGGFCVNGSCCPTEEQVCGQSCCEQQQTCFANACVVPGGSCFSARDCDPGQYCEPALGQVPGDGGLPGAGDAGPSADAGGLCLQPPPPPGRCLDLPPTCPDDGSPAPDGGCLQACEYHPQPDKLKAEVQWRWGPVADAHPTMTDVWSTPTVGRLYDTNCDGKLDEQDPPTVVFVSGDVLGGCACSPDKSKTGVLRMLDGASGQEIWSLDRIGPSSHGFAGFTTALGDVDKDGRMEIVASTGEGYVVLVSGDGTVERVSDKPIPQAPHSSYGWGGALALADMDADGFAEIAYGATVFSTEGGGIELRFSGGKGLGGTANRAISAFVDLDDAPDGHLELLAGNTAYRSDGSMLWYREDLLDGYPGVGDFDGDGKPEVVHVAKGLVTLLEGVNGETELGPLELALTTSDNGGPPTVADFDGDGKPEIGVAFRQYYIVIKADYAAKVLKVLWKTANHDLSSSVTGSTVFDFEGDGSAEVVYNDECFLWVYDGKTGSIRFAAPTSSFTATEASMVADVDGDGHAEMLMISNSADPSSTGWKCDVAPWNQPDPVSGRPAWEPPAGGTVYRGLTLWRDSASSWVGTRALWNQHTYHVTNICDPRDSACPAPNTYGSIPAKQKKNWTLPWLNNFRQNVQEQGIFDAPDATVTLKVDCTDPPLLHAYLRNIGLALLPAGVQVGFYIKEGGVSDRLLHVATTQSPLFPGQVKELTYQVLGADNASVQDHFLARVLVDPTNPTFQECRDDNNESQPTTANCLVE